MKLKNISSRPVIVNIQGKGVTLEPNKEVVVYDEDVEKEVSLLTLIKNGTLQKVSDEEPLESITGVDVDTSSPEGAPTGQDVRLKMPLNTVDSYVDNYGVFLK